MVETGGVRLVVGITLLIVGIVVFLVGFLERERLINIRFVRTVWYPIIILMIGLILGFIGASLILSHIIRRKEYQELKKVSGEIAVTKTIKQLQDQAITVRPVTRSLARVGPTVCPYGVGHYPRSTRKVRST